MRPRNVAHLPRSLAGPGSSAWIGMLLFVAIEATAYGSLITSYFYLQLGAERWPPDGIAQPALLLPTLSTALLVASAVPVRWAELGIRRGDERRLRIGLALGLLLASGYPVIAGIEASQRSYSLAANAYASIVWVASSYSLLHVVGLLGLGGYVIALAFRRDLHAEKHTALGVVALYWYFAALASIPLWATLYLAPRALGA
ncbi:heme-copper oxidase subunit III [Vulgatibacter sp.]|uniref:cytochrome c oxidase subunit 3 n=1 Tax=Vulgatibacter sp. TaxID=1971226 RepID=UPI003567777C